MSQWVEVRPGVVETSHGEATVRVDARRGARLASLRIGQLELLGGANLPDADPGFVSGSFVMAPYAGRVRDGRLFDDAGDHLLPLSLPPHAGHGLVYDREWTYDLDGNFSIAIDDRWPYGGWVRQRVDLTADSLHLILEVGNDDRVMPAFAGFHPWFPRILGGKQCRLHFSAGKQLLRGEDDLPSGAVSRPAPGPWDDCFSDVAQPVLLEWPDVATLSIAASTDYWVVFDERPEAFCVEPQTAPPDAFNSGLAQSVGPGAPLLFEMTWSWMLPEQKPRVSS